MNNLDISDAFLKNTFSGWFLGMHNIIPMFKPLSSGQKELPFDSLGKSNGYSMRNFSTRVQRWRACFRALNQIMTLKCYIISVRYIINHGFIEYFAFLLFFASHT